MNCSKVMSCSKSLLGNKSATHFDALRLCQVNTGTPTRTLVARLTAIRSRTAAVLPDNSWPVSSFPAIPSISLNTVFYTLNTCQPVPRSDSSLLPLLSTSHLNYWALSFKGTSSSHQTCRPSGLLHRSFTRGWSLPHVASWHWGNHSHAPHLLLTSTLAASQSLFRLSPS